MGVDPSEVIYSDIFGLCGVCLVICGSILLTFVVLINCAYTHTEHFGKSPECKLLNISQEYPPQAALHIPLS